jgi:hypothetical protein
MTSKLQNGWDDDSATTATYSVSTGPRARRRGSGMQQRFQPTQTDGVSSPFEMDIVRNEQGDKGAKAATDGVVVQIKWGHVGTVEGERE